MRFSKILLLSLTVIASVLCLSNSMLAAHRPAYAMQLIVKDTLTGIDTLYLGWAHGGASYGVDADTFDVAEFGVSVSENPPSGLPPLPPDGIFDARFVDTRSGAGVALDQGVPNNFHLSPQPYPTAVTDTFKVIFQGSATSGGAYPMRVSWNLPSSAYVQPTTWTIKYLDPDLGTQTVDMKTNTSLLFTSSDITNVRIFFNGTVGVREVSNVVPQAFALNQNYPNPFNPTTNISFAVQKLSDVTLAVYDVLGRKISTLTSERYAPGTYSATWNGLTDAGTPAASGTYYIRMNARYQELNGESNEFVSVQKAILMK